MWSLSTPDRAPDAKTPSALELLLQGYLTLDSPEDYEDSWAAVDDFIASEPIARDAAIEIAELLARFPDEAMLHRHVVEILGSGYLPESDGLSMREWLLAVHSRLSSDGRFDT